MFPEKKPGETHQEWIRRCNNLELDRALKASKRYFCVGCNKWHNSDPEADDFDDRAQTSRITPEGRICSRHFTPEPVEFTSDNIKMEREKHFTDIIQPRRGGEPSREFIEAYPKKAQKYFTKQEIKTAKNVWKGEPGWEHRRRKLPLDT